MANFVGRSGNHILFSDLQGEQGVVVDSRHGIVVASGALTDVLDLNKWEDGTFSAPDEDIADFALTVSQTFSPESTGRLYTVPRGVQNEAKRALKWAEEHSRGATPLGNKVATILASGGQIPFSKLDHVASFFSRSEDTRKSEGWDKAEDGTPSAERIAFGLRGGSAAERWTTAIIKRERESSPVSTFNPLGNIEDILEKDPEATTEFLARVRLDGSGIDRLYKIDLDGLVYVWGDGAWDNLGDFESDIWTLDAELDDPEDLIEKSHIVIDPESAIIISSLFEQNPFQHVSIEEIDRAEADMVRSAVPELDAELLDYTLTAAGAQGDGIYTEEERSENASKQVRDATGKFAKVGAYVQVGDNPQASGRITKLDSATGQATIQLDSGGEAVVPIRSTKAVEQTIAQAPVPAPGNGTPQVKQIDLTGILAEPRTPVNRVGAQIKGTLPQMSDKDLHSLLSDWPSWVKSQRDSFKDGGGKNTPVGVNVKNSTDVGDAGREIEKRSGQKLTVDAYDHPLLKKWLKKTSSSGIPNTTWYQPITAAAETPMSPETSDVQPLYMAIVAADDPRAVLHLVSLVPASSKTTAPMTYVRKDEKWVADPKVLADLNSATPPPVVPLDSDTLQDVLSQVDMTQSTGVPATDETVSETPEPTPLAASAQISVDHALMVLWGPQEALIAAGGADRNRGGAEKLRRYWTVGKGGLKIRWGTPGDWTRCVRQLSKYMGPRAKGYCALRHQEMTGMWTGDAEHRQIFTYTKGQPLDSTQFVESSEAVIASALLRAKIDNIKNRIELSQLPREEFGARFRIPLVIPEALESGDNRIAKDESVDLRDLPLPLMWQERTASGHDFSYVVGRIDSMERVDGGIGNATGYFDKGPHGREAERLVRLGFFRGVSVDLDRFEASEEEVMADDSDDKDSVAKKKLYINQARVMGVTIVAKPAFEECRIYIDQDDPAPEEFDMPEESHTEDLDPIMASALVACGYVASSIPIAPPRQWFRDPGLKGPTPITVTDEGRVFGHIASWSTNHIGYSKKTSPPRSKTRYAYFHTGILRTEDGSDVPVGQLTLAGGHASLEASARDAVRHYDDTASAVADVQAGEDSYGIWVSGGLRPGTTPEQIRALRASAPSGDWRPVDGHLELVAVCQVNVPGFPIARAMVASGQVTALVAAGVAPLAQMQAEHQIEMLEQFSRAELAARADSIRAKFDGVRLEQQAELTHKAQQQMRRMAEFGYTTPRMKKIQEAEALTASVLELRARVAAASDDEKERKKREELEKIAKDVDPEILEDIDEAPEPVENPDGGVGDGGADRPKYTPQTQPRDENGRFRLILARLRDNLGENGNQAVLDKIEAVENMDNVGDYKQASTSAADLINTIDRLDTKALNPEALANVRAATTDLGKVIANLPLPFNNQAEKVRFSDLPPALRHLVKTLTEKVVDKIGVKDGNVATKELRGFMSGSDVYSQSEISSQMNRMLRLLT